MGGSRLLVFLLLLAPALGARRAASVSAGGGVDVAAEGGAGAAGRAPRRAKAAPGPRRVAPLSLSDDLAEEAPLFSSRDVDSLDFFAAAAPAASAPILAPGRYLQLPAGVKPVALAAAPFRRGLVVADGAVHPNNAYAVPLVREKAGWLLSLLRSALGYRQPFPVGYLLSPSGATLRTLEFVDRATLARGLAESEKGDIAFTFYADAGVETWDRTLCVPRAGAAAPRRAAPRRATRRLLLAASPPPLTFLPAFPPPPPPSPAAT
jgi:hypothetical protein